MIRFVYTYAAALAIVICYTTVVHARFNFDEKAADWVVSPFYNDHTAYGAALAMFIPVMVSAATKALTIASSVACTVALNSASIWLSGTDFQWRSPSTDSGPTVLKAMKISPEPL